MCSRLCYQILVIHFIIFSFLHVNQCNALIEGIYCGKNDCYEVLGISRDADKGEIAKAYRLLARKYHPDMHHTKKGKKKAEEQFTAIATAYETLKDEESRKDYDYMLDHPDEYYRNYYQYYRRRFAPKVDVRIVIIVSITIISVIQYFVFGQRYNMAIDYFATTEKYKNQALRIAEKEKLMPESGKGKNRKTKEELKKEKEAVIRTIIKDKMDIKGGYAKPSIQDILWIQLVLLPVTFVSYVKWYVRWFWKFVINKEEYGREEKLYLIRKNIGLGELQFSALEDEKHEEYLMNELWNKDKFKDWKKIQEEEARVKMAEDNRYKRYRRYMRNHGPGQITFDE